MGLRIRVPFSALGEKELLDMLIEQFWFNLALNKGDSWINWE